MRRNFATLLGILCFMLPAARAAAAEERPNILFILVDDLGKEWFSCYGAEGIETPNIDALAAGGMRFENCWCMPQCTPTRVTLLTGQYPFRHGWTNHWDVPRWGAGCHFDPRHNSSFGLVLREAGYSTCAAGKWQIDDFRVEPRAMHAADFGMDTITLAGFDQWCMWTGGEGGNEAASNERYWNPYVHEGETSSTRKGEFGPDVYCNYLINFLDEHRAEPMLLYFPMALTHGPNTTTPDEPEVKGKLDMHMAMVRYTDKLVGRLVAALEEAGIRERTVIVFTTDNGTSGVTGRRNGHDVPPSKAKMVEAGVSIPLIVNAPGRVPAGVVTDALVDFTDFLPTFAELAGAKLPAEREVDGRSFAPLLLGKAEDSPREWIHSMGGRPEKLAEGRVVPAQPYDDRVLRDKRWKLWIDTNRRPAKLFDMRNDSWEERNLIASEEPEAVAARERLAAIAAKFPERDAAPRYEPNPPQKWDKKR